MGAWTDAVCTPSGEMNLGFFVILSAGRGWQHVTSQSFQNSCLNVTKRNDLNGRAAAMYPFRIRRLSTCSLSAVAGQLSPISNRPVHALGLSQLGPTKIPPNKRILVNPRLTQRRLSVLTLAARRVNISSGCAVESMV